LADTNNCQARFADDVFDHCGYEPQLNSDPVASATGYFAALDDLSVCIKNGGGQVIFDPPLDTTMFPLTNTAFTILDQKAVECGTGTFAGQRSYSVTINPVDAADAGTAVGPDGGILDDNITGGTFQIALLEDGERVDVSCPGGVEKHNFNLLQLQNCTTLQDFMPKAVLDSSRGVPQTNTEAGVPGFVRLRVYYPPENPAADGAASRIVEYFNCSIPAPPAPCSNMVLDGNETDVDCGGSCPTKCGEGQNCNSNNDCDASLGLSCGFVGGIQQCIAG
jgi:hypothetical protein